jgi:hypothetical protein
MRSKPSLPKIASAYVKACGVKPTTPQVYDPDSVSIKIDGVDFADLELRTLQLFSYEELGRENKSDEFDWNLPGLIIADEVHKLANKKAGAKIIEYGGKVVQLETIVSDLRPGDKVLVVGYMGPRAGVLLTDGSKPKGHQTTWKVQAEGGLRADEGCIETLTLQRSQFRADPVTPEIRSMIDIVCSPSSEMPEVLPVLSDWLQEQRLVRPLRVAKGRGDNKRERAESIAWGMALDWCHGYTGFQPGRYYPRRSRCSASLEKASARVTSFTMR